MFDFLNLKPETFGLDISDLSLKVVKLKKKRGVLGLASFGETAMKPGVIEQGEVKNKKTLIKVLKEAVSKVKGEKIKTKYMVASLPEEKAFLEVIQMPLMEEEEVKKAVRFEAENYIPLPLDQVEFDSQIIPSVHNHLDHFDVLIAALPKKTVASYADCLKQAGLVPLALEVESLAISRALIKNGVSPAPLFLIDMGATKTSFIVFSGYSLRFTASIPVSSHGFTEAIAKNLKVDLKKAEKMKLKYGLEKDKKVFEALIPSLTDLLEQIKKYIDYYQSHSKREHLSPNGKSVEKILLCGGGANLKGLADFLASELKLSVELGNPWANILPEPLKEVPELPYRESLRYTTAIGLAFREIQDQKEK